MARAIFTKADVARLVAGAIAGGLAAGAFEVRVEGGRLSLLPCQPVQPDELEDELEAWRRRRDEKVAAGLAADHRLLTTLVGRRSLADVDAALRGRLTISEAECATLFGVTLGEVRSLQQAKLLQRAYAGGPPRFARDALIGALGLQSG